MRITLIDAIDNPVMPISPDYLNNELVALPADLHSIESGIPWQNIRYYSVTASIRSSDVFPGSRFLFTFQVMNHGEGTPGFAFLADIYQLGEYWYAEGVTGATGATGPSSTVSTKAILFGGANSGFQRISGSPGAVSNTIPYVVLGAGNVSGFSGSINVNNLQVGTYLLQVCVDVANNASSPSPSNIVSTITIATTATITGTIVFSIRSTDIGAQPVYVYNPTVSTAPATISWTSVIPGNAVVRNNTISLYAAPNITQSAVYTVFFTTTS